MKPKRIFAAFFVTMMAFAAQSAAAHSIDKTLTPIVFNYVPDSLPSSDSLIVQLSNIDLTHYIGLPVDSLLSHLPSSYIEKKVSSYNRPDLAEVLFVDYNSDVSVMIFVHGFTYMNPHIVNTSTPRQNWQVSLFKKENLAYTIIFNGSTCINGCDHLRQ